MVNNPDTKSPTPVSQIHVEQPTIAATVAFPPAASLPVASPPAASPPAASPPAASLSSYFGGPDTAVGETGFDVILPSSVVNSGSVSILAEEVKDPNDFHAVSSIPDVPNIIEEALPEVQPEQSMQEENPETNKQPSVTTFFSTPNPVLEQITSYITSSIPVIEQTAPYITSPNPVLEQNASYIASPNPALEQTATYIASPNPVLEQTATYIASPNPVLEPNTSYIASPNPVIEQTATYVASPNPVLEQSFATFFTSPNPVLEEPSSLPYFSSTEAVAEVPEATANLTQTTTSFLPNPASEDHVPPNPEEQVEFIEQNFPSEPNYQPVTDNKAEVVTTEESETFTPSSHTESLKQLSSHLSGLR